MQVQQQRNQRPPKPRWRLSLGEWVTLLLNVLVAGFSGWLGWFKYLSKDTLYGGALLLIALGAGLTSLLLLLRQLRLAGWFQWMVALGICLFTALLIYDRQLNSLQVNVVVFVVALALLLLFLVSGRFLRTMDDEA
ncbi:hypothetical protein [Armatimonas sp.]|uniref:hypothetical protein n=1 Tax=Armatimonas sp. TaxID=1872638 RepID=UPI003752EF46